MRLAKWILNTILSLVTFLIILLLGYGLLFFVTWPAGSTTIDRIHIVVEEDEIGYLDAVTFWTTSITGNFNSEPEYIVRNWFSWEWWNGVALYPDIGIKYAKGVFIPLILPMYEMRQVTIYNGLDDLWNQLLTESNGKTFGEISNLQSFADVSFYLNFTSEQQARLISALVGNRSSWSTEYTDIQNIDYKIDRYNTETYDNLMSKFVDDQGLGLRRISGVAVILFFQLMFTAILTFLYVRQHPITLKKGEDSESQVEGDLIPVKLPGHKRRKQKKLEKKMNKIKKMQEANIK